MFSKCTIRTAAVVAVALFGMSFGSDAHARPRNPIQKQTAAATTTTLNMYNRSIQAKSNIASTHNKTADALVQNIRG